MQNVTINAANRSLGRVAAEAAKHLMGKTSASYETNRAPDISVTIEEAGKLRITERKRLGTVHTRYSGYPGGFKKETLSMIISKKGKREALRKAIERMLPRNRLRVARLKKLTIHE